VNIGFGLPRLPQSRLLFPHPTLVTPGPYIELTFLFGTFFSWMIGILWELFLVNSLNLSSFQFNANVLFDPMFFCVGCSAFTLGNMVFWISLFSYVFGVIPPLFELPLYPPPRTTIAPGSQIAFLQPRVHALPTRKTSTPIYLFPHVKFPVLSLLYGRFLRGGLLSC